MNAVAWWIEVPVGLLLAASGVFTLAAAIGLVRFDTFMQRLHPPALASTFAPWCVALACVLYFSAQDRTLSVQTWLIVVFLALTVPVTTSLLARTELFRKRTGGSASAASVAPALSRIGEPAESRDGNSGAPPKP